jgi:hypothetical protein
MAFRKAAVRVCQAPLTHETTMPTKKVPGLTIMCKAVKGLPRMSKFLKKKVDRRYNYAGRNISTANGKRTRFPPLIRLIKKFSPPDAVVTHVMFQTYDKGL